LRLDTAVVYYNEFDPKAAAWLRELIKDGLIADGIVDERSILDVKPTELYGYTQCHFFAGIGGWSYALRLAGWPDDEPVWTGSCPCQPFSSAGLGLGQSDERHLWPAFFYLISERQPSVVFGEQVEGAIKHGWLDGVASDLEREGYAVGSAVLQASAVNAKHRRDRLFFVADAKRDEQPRKEPCCRETGRVGRLVEPVSWNEPWSSALCRLRALDDGLSYGVAGCDGPRNAIVPQVGAAFIQAYLDISVDTNPAV
jgi:DNA (cytosine-5)-methyltransferase 1